MIGIKQQYLTHYNFKTMLLWTESINYLLTNKE
jgi:hypothetical protein